MQPFILREENFKFNDKELTLKLNFTLLALVSKLEKLDIGNAKNIDNFRKFKEINLSIEIKDTPFEGDGFISPSYFGGEYRSGLLLEHAINTEAQIFISSYKLGFSVSEGNIFTVTTFEYELDMQFYKLDGIEIEENITSTLFEILPNINLFDIKRVRPGSDLPKIIGAFGVVVLIICVSVYFYNKYMRSFIPDDELRC